MEDLKKERAYYKFDDGFQVPGKTVEEKEKAILKELPTIVIENYTLNKEDDCVEDFIYNFLLIYNRDHKTYWSDSKPGEPEYTVHKEDTLRSLLEIFLITKHYFPEVTLGETIKWLYNMFMKDQLGHQICYTVRRRVYRHKLINPHWTNYEPNRQDELGYTISDYEKISKELSKVEIKLEEKQQKKSVAKSSYASGNRKYDKVTFF